MSWYILEQIRRYPVKGMQGQALRSAAVNAGGIAFDHQWMVVREEDGMFVTQRQQGEQGVRAARICQLWAEVEGGELIISGPEAFGIFILPAAGVNGELRTVQVWEHSCPGIDQGEKIAKLLSDFLSVDSPGNYRLVRMPDDYLRPTPIEGSYCRYHDQYPFMGISTDSLAQLRRNLSEAGESEVPRDRFRPTFWFSSEGDSSPHFEDHLTRFQLSDVIFEGGTFCRRCAVISTDQETGVVGKEPSRTLATYRLGEHLNSNLEPNGIYFGRNFGHKKTGMIVAGREIISLSYGSL